MDEIKNVEDRVRALEDKVYALGRACSAERYQMWQELCKMEDKIKRIEERLNEYDNDLARCCNSMRPK